MSDISLYEYLLSVSELEVDSVEYSSQKITIRCNFQCKSWICPKCGQTTSCINKYDTRKVQELSITGKDVWLLLPIPQFYCSSCQYGFTVSSIG